MRMVFVLVACFAVAAFAFERNDGSWGHNPPSPVEGSYTIVDIYEVGLATSYGLAIQDDATDRLWICNWGELVNYEIDMTDGQFTGGEWDIAPEVDPDDEGYCEYGSGNQYLFGDYASDAVGVYDASGSYVRMIDGPSGWGNVFGVGAGHDMMYVSGNAGTEIAWGSYTGTESSVSWTTASWESVYGISEWGDYLFVSCGISGADNLFIFQINGDGSLNMTPVWSAVFSEEAEADGGIDWDGEYLWLYPQNTSLFKLDIDWVPVSLEASTWGQIKTEF